MCDLFNIFCLQLSDFISKTTKVATIENPLKVLRQVQIYAEISGSHKRLHLELLENEF